MIPPDLVSPLTSELGIGGVGGFCVGYSLKKLSKIISMFATVSFLGLQYLAYHEIISIDYQALEAWVISLVGETSELQGLLIPLITQMPLGVGFASGIVIGLKKG